MHSDNNTTLSRAKIFRTQMLVEIADLTNYWFTLKNYYSVGLLIRQGIIDHVRVYDSKRNLNEAPINTPTYSCTLGSNLH